MAHYRFDPERTRLVISGRSSVHPIRATAEGLVGWIETGDDGRPTGGHLTVEVAGLRTGNPLYDREIRNRLEVRKFPTVEAHLLRGDEGGPEHEVTGTVSAHGVQEELEGTIEVRVGDAEVRVSGSEEIDFRRFGLEAPRLLTLKVDPVVTVTLEAAGPRDEPTD